MFDPPSCGTRLLARPQPIGNGGTSRDTAWAAAEARDVATIEDFEQLDIRVGRVVDAKPFPEAKKPAFRLWIDFGEPIGTKQSSAQITVHYHLDQLIGRQVLAVVNFPPRKIGAFVSEVLTLGVPDEDGAVVLLKPDFQVPSGGRMF